MGLNSVSKEGMYTLGLGLALECTPENASGRYPPVDWFGRRHSAKGGGESVCIRCVIHILKTYILGLNLYIFVCF